MTTFSTPRPPDPLLSWEREIRTAVIGDLSPATVGTIVGVVAVGALGSTVAAAAIAAAAEGGVTMTTITASAASNVALKAAAWGLAATLAVGGTAAVTGNLPDGAQEFTADAAAHIGLTLPRPDTSVSGSLNLGDVFEVEGAGQVGARLDGEAIVLTGIEAGRGFEAHIVSQTAESILVEFRSATETATVLLTSVDGRIVSDVNFGAEAEAQVEAQAQADAEAEPEAEADAEAEAEAEAEIDITIGG